MPYEYLEESATADIAFHAEEETLEKLFITSGDAVMNIMIEDLDSIQEKEEEGISLVEKDLELLLFDFLQEFIYFKDSKQLLLRAKNVKINKVEEAYTLTATLKGEVLDPIRHEQRVDVKAVTLHGFNMVQTKGGWEATVILDI